MAEISGGSIVYSVDLNTTQATKAADDFGKGAKRAATASDNFGKTLKDSVGGVLSGFVGPELRLAGKLFGALTKDLKASALQADKTAKATKSLSIAQRAAAVATNGWNASLKVLKVAIAATGIGALLVLLGSLVASLTTTQKGIDAVNRVTTILGTIFQRLIGVAQDLGTRLIEAFKNPQEAVKDFANGINDFIIETFKDLGKILGTVGDALLLLFKFEFAEAAKVAKTAFDGVGESGKGLFSVTKDLVNAGKELVKESIAQGNALADLDIAIRKATLAYTQQEAELNNLIATQREIAIDASKSEEERAKAAQNALNAINQRAALEENLIKLQLERLIQEQKLNETLDEGFQERAELEAKLLNVQTQASRERRFLTSALNNAEKQIAEERIKREQEIAKEFLEANKAKFDTAKELTEIEAREAALQAQIKFALSKQTKQDAEELAEALVEIERAKLQQILNLNQNFQDALTISDEDIKSAALDLAEFEVKVNADKNKRILQQEERTAQDRLAFQQQVVDKSIELIGSLFAFGDSLRQRELAAIQAKVDSEVITEEQAAQEIAQIKRKQAQADRARALFGIAVNLAEGIARLLANPTIAGGALPLIGLTSGIAAAQTAAVLAQPLPAFAEGTLNAPGGMALVGEEGPELVKLPKGAQVMPSPQTMLYDSIMQGNMSPSGLLAGIDFDGGRQWDDSKLRRVGERGVAVNSQMLSEIKGLRKAIIGTPKKYK